MRRYVFYLGGPQAVVSDCGFWREDVTFKTGCTVAREAGVRVPYSTYGRADGAVSQAWGCSFGRNSTALLPLEV